MMLEMGGYLTDKGISGKEEYAGGPSEASTGALLGTVVADAACVTFASILLALPGTELPKWMGILT